MQDGEMPLDPQDLDLGSLALFVGNAAAARVQAELEAAGFTGLRSSHGYLFQHLVEAEPTIGELAALMRMTQQAVSKTVAELEGLGYVERVPDARDGRIRRIRLTAWGRDAIDAARRSRAGLDELARTRFGDDRLDQARTVLVELLDALGGVDEVRLRRVRPPR
jgi:DNA-binding MarR family transcriptional regulator